MSNDVLFSTYDLDAVLQAQMRAVHDRVLKLGSSQFASSSDEELAERIVKDLVINAIEFDEDEISVGRREAKVDVSQDFLRAVYDRSQPAYVEGLRITFHVPFTGDKKLFACRPNPFTFHVPRAVVGRNELVFTYLQPGIDVGNVKQTFLEELAHTKEWVARVNHQVAAFNDSLPDTVLRMIGQRRLAEAHTDGQMNALGFKVRPPK